MARLSVLAAVVAGVLLAVAVGAAPAPAETFPEVCNPDVCMRLAVYHSDCLDGFNPDLLAPESTQCVCSEPTLKENYLNCYGICTNDEATEPYCGQPVKEAASDDEEATPTTETVDGVEAADTADADADATQPVHPEITAPAEFNEPDDIAEHQIIHTLSNRWGMWCVVPGQACYGKAIATTLATETTAAPRAKVTAPAELHGRDELVERQTHTLSNRWGKWCVVPGQACYNAEFAAAATDAPGSDFVDVGDAESDELEGKIGGGDKRAVGVVNAPVPTTLQIINDYLHPSN